MIPANISKRKYNKTKLLVFDHLDNYEHSTLDNLVDYFNKDDLLVINISATIPSSFRGYLERNKEFIEIRLAAFQGPDKFDLTKWQAIAFGEGNWQQKTEERKLPPKVFVGDYVYFSENLRAKITDVKQERILEIEFISNNLLREIYQHSKPIQYSYHQNELKVWDQQTIFSGFPLSVEPPSAAIQFNWETILKLKNKGVKIAYLLHSAGISSTGDHILDQNLPLKEWYEIPEKTVELINQAKKDNKKIVALGTTVIRALESSPTQLKAGSGIATLKINAGFKFKHVNALITGMHEPESSHIKILYTLCSPDLIKSGFIDAEKEGYQGHEYGDLSFLKCNCS